MAKKIDIAAIAAVIGTLYPPPFDTPCRRRERKPLAVSAGLTQFGVNLLRLPPGAWSSQRHWHDREDEFVFILAGEATLVTDAGAETLRAGQCAAFKAGEQDGHCLQNRSNADVLALEIGSRIAGDGATYSDIDLLAPAEGPRYTRKDGTAYPDMPRSAG